MKVSLTKHGAYKVAKLLNQFPLSELLQKLWAEVPGINIDPAQTSKNLSVSPGGTIPQYWELAQTSGQATTEELVMCAIIFSHHRLIDVMKNSSTGKFQGTIIRNKYIGGKTFSNFANNIEELGFSGSSGTGNIEYDMGRIYSNSEIPKLLTKMLADKLSSVGWSGSGNVQDEAVSLGLHEVYGLDEIEFRDWLSTEEPSGIVDGPPDTKSPYPEFKFKAGFPSLDDTPASTRVVSPKKKIAMKNLHIKIQKGLYKDLLEKYGEGNVGAEVPTGFGTSIDLMVVTANERTIYEIKTDESDKFCIREAFGQLLEYNYWPDRDIAENLVIVSQNELTPEGETYLNYLRSITSLPISYKWYKL